MGCTVREKHIRTNRKPRSAKPEFDPCCGLEIPSIPKSMLESAVKPLNYHMGVGDPTQNANASSNPNLSSKFDDGGWGYCTEEQLEEILLKNFEFLYNEAISKLVVLGCDEEIALKAILHNGHCYGTMDVLTNIVHNSLAYLNGSCADGCADSSCNVNSDEHGPVFVDLRQLEEYSLAGMVCLLQQVRPHLTKGDAMWCLLMSDLHVGRASAMEIPIIPSLPNNGKGVGLASKASVHSITNHSSGTIGPPHCRFHGGWGFGNAEISEFNAQGVFSYGAEMNLQRDIESPKSFNLSPSMKSMLKRNVALFAAGFRANPKNYQTLPDCTSSLPVGDFPVALGGEVPTNKCEETQDTKNQDATNSVLCKFRDLNLNENTGFVGEDQKDEVIVTLVHQIKDLERQVKERKEWAHQKAMQAARKLSNDLRELKILRMEREETQRLKKGKHTLEDTTLKRLSDMENALRKASGQVDRANAAVRRLETENAEIRAEMEASKLSASESVAACLEVAKREKKCLKRLLAWEKQKTKLQEGIVEEKEKIAEFQDRLVKIKQAQKEAEVKWRQEVNAKELALIQVEEERRLKEAAEGSCKRKLEALRLKVEVDFQRHKDDLERLEQELSHLKSSALAADSHHPSNNSITGNSEGLKTQGETIAKMLQELDNHDNFTEREVGYDRECIICTKAEVSIVFLPCAHQVLCANCSDSYGKTGNATCPCCRAPIEQRIRVFGASS